jgi:septal ring factor EnvC (AmiA/AmiB activator)
MLDNFRKEVAELNRKVSESGSKLSKIQGQLDAIENAVINYPGGDLKLLEEVRNLQLARNECSLIMWGDRIKSSREFEVEPSLSERFNMLEYKLYENRSGVSNTHRRNKEIVEKEWISLNQKIENIETKIALLKENLKKAGLPFISE